MLRKSVGPIHELTKQKCIVMSVTISGAFAANLGRPRSTQVSADIFDAVLDSVGAGATLSSLSIAGLAEVSGVSRNSIYRRWKTKEDLFSDVVKSMRRPVPVLTEQSARENLIEIVKMMIEEGDEPRNRRMKRAIANEGESFSDLYELYVTEVVLPMQTAMKMAIRRGKVTGEIRNDVDEDLLTAALVSFANSWTNLPETQDSSSFCGRFVDLVFDGAAPN